MNSIDRIIFKNNDIPTTYLISNSIEGYLNTTDGKFYKESSYTTEIAGAATVLYLDKATNKLYRYNESNHQYIAIVGGGSSITIDDEIDSSSTNPVQNKVIYSALEDKIDNSLKGANNGIAELDSNGKLNFSQLPLGEASSTAYRGDRGKTAYDHSQITSGNPHNVTASEIGLGNVNNTADIDKPISTAVQTALNLKANSEDLGTAATKNIPASGDASTTEVVMGNDSRLTDSRNAADVSSWAKAANKPSYTASEVGAYTKSEVDNKISTLETNIDWKETVATFSDIATTYPNPVDGWTVNVKDTDYTYRYNGSAWVAISANAIPQATTSVNGLMTTTQVTKLDGIATGAEVNVQSDWDVTDSSSDAFIKNKPTIPDISTKMDKANPTGTGSFSLNRNSYGTTGSYSFVEGYQCIGSGNSSHAEGFSTIASAQGSHSEGAATTASGVDSHAEGTETEASANHAHAEGSSTKASGSASHAEGYDTVAGYNFQHVGGKFNDNKATTLFEIGNGTDDNTRSNAFEVYNDGSLSTDNGTTKIKLENLVSQSEPIENTVDFTDVISITDALPVNAKDVKLKVDAVQDLHGYDNPWVGGAGKNKLPTKLSEIKTTNTFGTWSGNSYTWRGITYTILIDESDDVIGIKMNGTATEGGATLYWPSFTVSNIPSGAYILSLDNTSSVTNGSYIYMNALNGNTLVRQLGFSRKADKSISVDYADYNQLEIGLRINSGDVVNNATFYPMLRPSGTSADFEPYTNICPISGWDNAKVVRAGKNLYNKEAPNVSSIANKTSITQLTNGIRVTAVESSSYLSIAQIVIDDLTAYEGKSLTLKCKYTHKSSNGILCALQGLKNGTEVLWDTMNGIDGEAWTTVNITSAHAGATLYFRAYISASNTISVGDYTDYTEIQIEVGTTATSYEPYKETRELTISLGGTRYGGILDVTSGVLTLTKAIYDLGDYSYNHNTGDNRNYFYTTAPISAIKGFANSTANDGISNKYVADSWNNIMASNPTANGKFAISSDKYFGIRDDNANSMSTSDFKTYVTGTKILATLATPQTIQLTPTEVKLLLGYNILFGDTGDISLTYNPATFGNVVEEVGELEGQLTNEVSTRAMLGAHNLLRYKDNWQAYSTPNGITASIEADGGIKLLGTVSPSNAIFPIYEFVSPYTVSAIATCDAPDVNEYFVITNVTDGTTLGYLADDPKTLSLVKGKTYKFELRISNGTSMGDGITLHPMLRLATDAVTNYEAPAKTNVELTEKLTGGIITVSNYSASEANAWEYSNISFTLEKPALVGVFYNYNNSPTKGVAISLSNNSLASSKIVNEVTSGSAIQAIGILPAGTYYVLVKAGGTGANQIRVYNLMTLDFIPFPY